MAFMPASAPPISSSRYGAASPVRGVAWTVLLLLAIPLLVWLVPSHKVSGVDVAPLSPALAAALAGTALWGWRALPAVALGALVAAFGWPLVRPDAAHWMAAATLVVQSAFGGMLLRRSGRADDTALDTVAALRRLVASAIACGVIGGLMLALGDLAWSSDPSLRPGMVGLARATADAASIVMLMPILMAGLSPYRSRWLQRRRTVALPLIAVGALLFAAFEVVEDRDRQQAQQRFERDAEIVLARTQTLLDAPLQALLAMQGAFAAAGGEMPTVRFDELARVWVRRSLGVESIGWIDVAATAGRAAPAGTSPEAGRTTQLRHVLGAPPLRSVAGSAQQESVLTLPALQPALARATAQRDPVVSPPLMLGAGIDARPGVVLLQNLPQPGTPGHLLAFATVLPDALVGPIIAARSDALRACLYDADPQLELRRLAGASGCELRTADDGRFVRETVFEFAGRRWAMRTSQPVRTSGGIWLFALPALGGGALLAVFLSGVTGQVQRVRAEARSRSDELRHELDGRARSQAAHDRSVHVLMDTVQIGMALIDTQGRILHVNAAFAEFAGAGPEALRHQSLDDILVDTEANAAGRFARLVAHAGDELQHQPMRLKHADAHDMPALVTLRVLRDDAGRATSAICAVHDLSENLRRRQVERVLGEFLDLSRSEGKTAASPRSSAAASAAPQRVLCIAADAGLADELRSALHDRPRIVMDRAEGGPQGLVSARTQSPALVLLDLDLPDADSLALMRTLTSEGIAVVALSRDLRPQRIEAAFAAGARGYLTLPPEPRELLAIIDDLL